MSEVLVELVSLRKKLESCDQENTDQLLRYLSRLNELPITKNDIRSSKINEILRLMSKNSKNTFNQVITHRAKRIRENWKHQLNRQKSGIPKKEKAESISKVKEDKFATAPPVRSQPRPEPPQNEQKPAEEAQPMYNGEVFMHYDELEDKNRKRVLTMLVKIFGKLGHILVRVFKDRVGLGQPAFCPNMKFKFSNFFVVRHRDSLLQNQKWVLTEDTVWTCSATSSRSRSKVTWTTRPTWNTRALGVNGS